jgi:hypothetical protein
MNVGKGVFVAQGTTSSSAADPQLQFFENFPGKDGAAFNAISLNTLSVHAVNIPLSLSFNYPVLLFTRGANDATRQGGASIQFGLYSLNVSTLSLENSASNTVSWLGANSSTLWISLVTSATQNITPGAWYFALNVSSSTNNAGAANFRLFGNSSINPGNANPAMVMGRMTVSTNAIPASIATSDLDITGSDATRQSYIIITA